MVLPLLLYAGAAGGLEHNHGATATPPAQASVSLKIVAAEDVQAVGALFPLGIDRSPRPAPWSATLMTASAIIGISGAPGQVYSVRLSGLALDPDGATPGDLSAWSDTAAAAVVAGRPLFMDAEGRDILRLKATLRPAERAADAGKAPITVGIDYQ